MSQPPPIMINDPRVTTPYPQFASDPEVLHLSLFHRAVLNYLIFSMLAGLVNIPSSTTAISSNKSVPRGPRQVSQITVQHAVNL